MRSRFILGSPALLLVAGAWVLACGGGSGSSASGGGQGSTSTAGSTTGGVTGAGGASTSTSSTGATSSTSGTSGAGGAPTGMVPGIITVGYGGLRVVSRDQGLTWGDRAFEVANGGDDEVLLRAVTYGKGLWIATGWKYWTSPNGVAWTDHGLVGKGILPCSIVEGLAYHEGAFWAACGVYVEGQPDSLGGVFRSTDGMTWDEKPFGIIGDTTGHLTLAARAGQMVAWGDNGVSFASTDGASWSVMPGLVAATYCDDQWKSLVDCDPTAVGMSGGKEYYDGVSFFDGVWLKSAWQGLIVRATDGVGYATVYTDDQKNGSYAGRTFASGYVAPKN